MFTGMLQESVIGSRSADVVRHDVPTCHLKDFVGEVYKRCREVGWKVCLVVNEANVVLGRVRQDAWQADPEAPVEQVMENGPTTFRPDNFLEPLTRRMQEKRVGSVIITDADGILMGILYRQDAEQRLHQLHARIEHANREEWLEGCNGVSLKK